MARGVRGRFLFRQTGPLTSKILTSDRHLRYKILYLLCHQWSNQDLQIYKGRQIAKRQTLLCAENEIIETFEPKGRYSMPKKVLVVDNDPIIVRYLINVFNDNGYATCSATNGVEAFEVLRKERPDLITLDLEMPEETGPRFYRKLTKSKEFKNTPVIVISGMPSRHLAIKNAIVSLSKPFDAEKLIGIVKNTIG